MTRVLMICKQCGYEQFVDVYKQDEARRKNIRLVRPRCAKCGSFDIEMRK